MVSITIGRKASYHYQIIVVIFILFISIAPSFVMPMSIVTNHFDSSSSSSSSFNIVVVVCGFLLIPVHIRVVSILVLVVSSSSLPNQSHGNDHSVVTFDGNWWHNPAKKIGSLFIIGRSKHGVNVLQVWKFDLFSVRLLRITEKIVCHNFKLFSTVPVCTQVYNRSGSPG